VPLPTTRTWATVAASPNGTCQSSGTTPSYNESLKASAKEAHCVRISRKPRDTQTDTENLTFTRYLPTEAANAQIRNALLNADATKDLQVTGVGTTKTGYAIHFKDE
jgi:ribosomal protein S10